MSIKIMNLKKETPLHPYDFFIDRRSPLGNKFPMYKEADRIKVIKKYKKWFKVAVNKKGSYVSDDIKIIKQALKQYGKVRLFCWCSPLPCHGDIVKKYLKGKL